MAIARNAMSSGPCGRRIGDRRSRPIVASMLAMLAALSVSAAQPAAASGGGTVWVRADGVWRTQTFTVYDPTIPSACPGPTGQGLTITATFKGTSSGYFMQSIYMKNTTSGVVFDNKVDWDGRLKYAYPRTTAWVYGKQLLLTSWNYPYTSSSYQTVSAYQAWSSGGRGLHQLTVENGGGMGCWPVFQISVVKY